MIVSKIIDKDREGMDKKIDKMVNQLLKANNPSKRKQSTTGAKRKKK